MDEALAGSTPLSERRVAQSTAAKILITGTHSTGKTTLVLDVVARLRQSSVEIIAESARNCPFVLNTHQNLLSTTWLIASQLRAEVEAQTRPEVDLVICDRGLPDILAYHEMATGVVEPWLVAMAEGWMSGYDQVFVARPDPARPMSSDELRVEDTVFRANVQRVIESHVRKAGVAYELLPHGLPERLEFVEAVFGGQGIPP